MTRLTSGTGEVTYTLSQEELAHIITMNTTGYMVVNNRVSNENIFNTAKGMTLKEIKEKSLVEMLLKPYNEIFSHL